MVGRCKVFIVDHDPDLNQLLQLVVEQNPGCEVQAAMASGVGAAAENLERIKQHAPDLVILDFVRGRNENWRLLDQLRTDEGTSSIPVLSLATSEPLLQQTLASYNVRAILVKPFDLDQVSNTVREVLSQPRVTLPPIVEQPGIDVLREASDILAAHAREIVGEWLCQVHGIEPFKGRQPANLPKVVNAMPVLLWGTIVALRVGVLSHVFEQNNDFRAAAVEHALLRRQEGNSLGSLIREYDLLRDCTWEALRDKYPRERWLANDVFRVGEIVHRALDEIVIIAVQAYGEDQPARSV